MNGSTITIATWNVWWRFEEWESRQEPIIEELLALNADVITLQETWPEQARSIAKRLGANWVWAGRNPGSTAEHAFGNAVITRWPILRDEFRMLADEEGRMYRSVLHAMVKTPDRPVAVYTTHLEHRYAQSRIRQRQLATVTEFIAGNGHGDIPTVLTGDLNATPDSDEIRRLTGRSTPYVEGSVWTDAWEVAGAGTGETWSSDNPWLKHPTWPDRRLDYVMVEWPRLLRPVGNPSRADRFGMSWRNGVIPSDHFGVVAELHW